MTKHSPIRYVAITTHDGDRFVIRVTKESARFVTGVEVDKEGEEIVGKDFDKRMRVVEIAMIKKAVEMRMNVVYGRIERVVIGSK